MQKYANGTICGRMGVWRLVVLPVPGGASRCMAVPGGAWWCLAVPGGAWWCLVVSGGAGEAVEASGAQGALPQSAHELTPKMGHCRPAPPAHRAAQKLHDREAWDDRDGRDDRDGPG